MTLKLRKKMTLKFLTALILVSPAFAATISYTLTSGSDTITFSLPQMPTTPLLTTVCPLSSNCFSLSPVSLTVDGSAVSNGVVNFYSSANTGGLTISEGSTLLVNNNGPGNEQLFTGTFASPTLETFTNLQLIQTGAFSPRLNEAFLLNAVAGTNTSTPEPSSVLLLLTGGAATAGMRMFLRSRNQGIRRNRV